MDAKNIIIVDAAPLRPEFLLPALEHICRVRLTRDYEELRTCLEVLTPDLILLLEPAGPLDSLALLGRLQADPKNSYLPVFFGLTAPDYRLEAAALARGAADCFTWPLPPHILRLKVKRLLQAGETTADLTVRLRRAEQEQTVVRTAFTDICLRLLAAQDPRLAAHARRVGRLAGYLAGALSRRSERFLAASEVPLVAAAACLHDLGKLSLPPALRSKEENGWNREQLRLYRSHPLLGQKLWQTAGGCLGGSAFGNLAAQVAAMHHELCDGSGYPAALKGRHIPFAAQIAAVANRFDHCRQETDSDSKALAAALGSAREGLLFAPVIDHVARECAGELAAIRV